MCCPVNGNRVYNVLYVCIFRKIWQTMPLKRKLAMADVEKKNPIFYLIWLSCDAFETCILPRKKSKILTHEE